MSSLVVLLGGLVAAMQGVEVERPVPVKDPPLALSDLPEYRAALQPHRPGETEPRAQDVKFRELWEHPEAYRGGRVQVTGRVVRMFHQQAFGTFPALAEVWIASSANDLICIVFPESGKSPAPELGSEVRFAGTFLRRIQYKGADVPRLAPLIVGNRVPVRVRGSATTPVADPMNGPAMSSLDIAFGIMIGIILLGMLARLHLRRPVHLKVRPEVEPPPPQFLDGGEPGGDFDER